MAEEEKDDWLDDIDDDGEGTGSADLDQSDIDSLLTDDDEAAAPQESKDAGLDQSNLDSLQTDDDSTKDEDPSQEDIDQLFSEVDDEAGKTAATVDDPFQAEEIDFKDLAADVDSEALDEADNGFDAEAFGLDDDDELPDIPDISDGDSTIMEDTAKNESHETSQFLDNALDDDKITKEGDTTDDTPASPAKFVLPAILQDRKIQAGIGGVLILLLAAIFMLRGEPAKKAPVSARIPATASTKSSPQPPAPLKTPIVKTAPPNTPPQVSGASLYIRPGDTELAINLKASDADHDPLNYEIITLPKHGKLSGQAPNLIYLPNKDFVGKDSIVFRVSDGRTESPAATIQINSIKDKIESPTTKTAMGEATKPKVAGRTEQNGIAEIPANKPAPTLKTKTIKPRRLVIAAINATYSTISTKPLNINWKKLWAKANYLPFSRKTKIEIISSNLHGHLRKISPSHYIYQPDKYFSGTEYIRYRFRLARLKSRPQTIRLRIKPGYPAPEIKLGHLAASYAPGEKVTIDASATRDEARKDLIFSWQQVGGTPVKIRLNNQEGSKISFIAPSSFNTISNPGPLLRLTVVDIDGQRATRKIKIATHSRRNSAIWNEMAAGIREEY